MGSSGGGFQIFVICHPGVSLYRRARFLEHNLPPSSSFRSQDGSKKLAAADWLVRRGEKMGNRGKRRIGSREEDAFLDLLRTCDLLSRGLAHLLKSEDISATQYNVLRILRGSPAGLPCGEIASRMITRDPDVTRLLDRLERRNLISRSR